jgi:hypothetical protein
MFADVHITTQLLWRATLFFGLADLLMFTLLAWRIPNRRFQRLPRWLAGVAAIFWASIWLAAMVGFWGMVYRYIFPGWARWVIPFAIPAVDVAVALLLWRWVQGLPGRSAAWFCLFTGVWGSLTHVWAVALGITVKPPMLQGASPIAVIVFAFFEYLFYFNVILALAALFENIKTRPLMNAE